MILFCFHIICIICLHCVRPSLRLQFCVQISVTIGPKRHYRWNLRISLSSAMESYSGLQTSLQITIPLISHGSLLSNAEFLAFHTVLRIRIRIRIDVSWQYPNSGGQRVGGFSSTLDVLCEGQGINILPCLIIPGSGSRSHKPKLLDSDLDPDPYWNQCESTTLIATPFTELQGWGQRWLVLRIKCRYTSSE
jgi:hypothetical protein